jgi:hypothetical protein
MNLKCLTGFSVFGLYHLLKIQLFIQVTGVPKVPPLLEGAHLEVLWSNEK